MLPREREDGIDSKYGIGVVISKRNVEPNGGIGQPPGTGRRARPRGGARSRVPRGGWNLGEKGRGGERPGGLVRAGAGAAEMMA